MPFQIVRNDITKIQADAIVNTANPEVAIGWGVDEAIYNAAGRDELLAAREKLGRLMPGEVGVTEAFNLPAKYIIHSSGPEWQGGEKGEIVLLQLCYQKALALAYDRGCESIAFPLMATGTYGFPKELGLQVAIDSFQEFLQEHEMQIYLVVYDTYAYKISGDMFNNVQNYLDDHYEEPIMQLREAHACYGASAPKEKARNHKLFGKSRRETLAEMAMPQEMMAEARPMMTRPEPMLDSCYEEKQSLNLEEQLKGMFTDSFEKHLQQLINKKGMKNSEVYAGANMSKQYFSKLIKGQVKPSKEKVLALAVALHLNLDEAVDFLGLAGYAFSPISQTDVIVKYFIEKKDYSVIKIDIVLFDYALPSLTA